ncbi:unnamed protein product [Diamesa tonsa]
MSMDVHCANFEWTEKECIRSELIKFKDVNISWCLLFYPVTVLGPQVKIIIEDTSNGALEYNCRFRCQGGLNIDVEADEFSSSDEEIAYDSTMTQVTKCIEKSKIIQHLGIRADEYFFEYFTLNAELTVESTSEISHDISSSIELCSSQESFDQFETSSNHEIVSTSVRSSAFVECISKIVDAYKNNDTPDLVILASKLVEAARKFDLPDLEKISTGFLDFKISKNNFADVLEMAIDHEIDALVNMSLEFVCNNQKDLRATKQWEKMKACPLMMLSILEKLFIDKDLSRTRLSSSVPS